MIEGWRVVAHVGADPLAEDWHAQLVQRLGYRPRRVGTWTELAMHGALRCIDAAGEAALPAGARLRVGSQRGPWAATCTGLEQLDAGLTMPFTFMQSQPALALAEVGRCLGWRGDGSFVLNRDAEQLLRLVVHGAGADGLLLGQVEEAGGALPMRSEWWRLLPA